MRFLNAFDQAVLGFLGSLHRPWLDQVVTAITHLGATAFLATVAVCAALFFYRQGRPIRALVLILTSLGCWGLEWAVKLIVQRPRPDVPWRLIDWPAGLSFPSGHAMKSMCVYVGMALLLAPLLRRNFSRRLVIGLGVGLSLLIGCSRPYLGVHYPTDVLAGWVAGLACALIGAELADVLEKDRQQKTTGPGGP